MKGIVFDEFTEMVESMFGEDMLDDLLDENAHQLASGGAYTSVGTYDYEELVVLVSALSEKTNLAIPVLVRTFGLHLANVFTRKFPTFFDECKETFEFLKRIDDHIHVEVNKLYPDAELPEFSYEQSGPDRLLLHYRSSRGLSDLAHGLIDGVAEYYQDSIMVEINDASTSKVQQVTFCITKV